MTFACAMILSRLDCFGLRVTILSRDVGIEFRIVVVGLNIGFQFIFYLEAIKNIAFSVIEPDKAFFCVNLFHVKILVHTIALIHV
jgi:hypothetical protein